MGFFSFIGDVVDGFTGKGAADAAEKGADLQYQSTQEARQQQERLNQPYLQLGQQGIEQFQPFLNDPSGASFLEGNPMFNAAVDYTSDRLENRGAAAGRFNSGGMVNELFQNYLATGDQFVNSAYQRAYNPVMMGQNAANFQGTNSANLITGGANAQAAGQVGAANAYSQGASNLVNTGLLAAGMWKCDIRLKENIEPVRVDDDGLTVYEFDYIGESGRWRGKMAQDLRTVYPQDVMAGEGGYLRVTARHAPERVYHAS